MSNSGGIPELAYNHPDGRQRTRLEMEQWLRQEIPKVHWLRIIATRLFGLEKKLSWDMREIVLKHWLLDEMVRRQYIVGDQLGINQNSSNDDAELRQFTQRLAFLIQAGQAVSPQHAEGVDMTQFTPPPPPVMGGPAQPNGQNGQQAYPPGPPQPPMPPGPPGGYAQPPGPPGPPMGPPGGYAQPPMPPQQGGYAPPPQPQGPPAGPPQGYAPPPPAGPHMAGPPMGPPPGVQAPPPPAGGRGGRRKPAEQGAAPQQPPGPPGAPQGFAPAPMPGGQAPGGFAPLPPQGGQQSFQMPGAPQAPQAPQAAVDPALGQKLDQLLTLVSQQATKLASLEREMKILSQVNTVLARAIYQKPGSQDPAGFLTELGLPVPQ